MVSLTNGHGRVNAIFSVLVMGVKTTIPWIFHGRILSQKGQAISGATYKNKKGLKDLRRVSFNIQTVLASTQTPENRFLTIYLYHATSLKYPRVLFCFLFTKSSYERIDWTHINSNKILAILIACLDAEKSLCSRSSNESCSVSFMKSGICSSSSLYPKFAIFSSR